MGAGASSRQTAKAPVKGFALPNPAALQRRRRILFGGSERRRFEDFLPRQQFGAVPEESDPVFKRVGDLFAANQFRRRAEHVQYSDGYLHENALELLGLGLSPYGELGQRLFRVAQVQSLSGVPRQPYLTCYELMALYSVLRHGTDEDLLELLYCVFDADGDDRVGMADLSSAVDAFMELSASEAKGAADAAARKRQRRLAGLVAEAAMKDFGVVEAPAPEPSPQPAQQPAQPAATKVADDEDSDDSGVQQLEPAVASGATSGEAQPPLRRRFICSFCSGKKPAEQPAKVQGDAGSDQTDPLVQAERRKPTPLDWDSDEEKKTMRSRCAGCLGRGRRAASAGLPADQAAPAAPTARRSRCGLCRGKAPAEDPAAKAPSTARRGCSFCQGEPPADDDSEGPTTRQPGCCAFCRRKPTQASATARASRSLLWRGRQSGDEASGSPCSPSRSPSRSPLRSPSQSLRLAGEHLRKAGRGLEHTISQQLPAPRRKPSMGYDQWKRWLLDSHFLPTSLAVGGGDTSVKEGVQSKCLTPSDPRLDTGGGVFSTAAPARSLQAARVEDSSSDDD